MPFAIELGKDPAREFIDPVAEASCNTFVVHARELNIDAVIEGSVLWTDTDVRITLQLIHGETDHHLCRIRIAAMCVTY